jgi:hypothetical protein
LRFGQVFPNSFNFTFSDIYRLRLERPAVCFDARQSPPAVEQTQRRIAIAVVHPLREMPRPITPLMRGATISAGPLH